MRAVCIGVAAMVLSSSFAARADLANNAGIDDHVDALLAPLDIRSLTAEQTRALLADRLSLNLGVLVPVLGSFELDTKVYGEVRPAAVLFDWILGGLIPASLAATALAGRGVLDSTSRTDLAWMAVGLYGVTRIGILVVGNLHISEYNRRMTLGLAASAPDGRLGPTISLGGSW